MALKNFARIIRTKYGDVLLEFEPFAHQIFIRTINEQGIPVAQTIQCSDHDSALTYLNGYMKQDAEAFIYEAELIQEL